MRRALTAVSVLLVMLALTAGAAAAQPLHPYCAARQHDCDAARISSCCCGDVDRSWTDAAPIPPRMEVHADTTVAESLAAACGHVLPTVPRRATRQLSPSPPGRHLIDFTTLFAALLI